MENNTLCNRHSLGVNNHTKMYVTYTRIYGWSDYGGESSYQPGYRLENMMWMTLLVYDYIIPGEKFYQICTNHRYEKILYKDIYYVYKDEKYAIFVTQNGNIPIRETLKNIYKDLEQKEFIFIDRGYIVNVVHIMSLYKNTIYLRNSKNLKISRTYTEEVKKRIHTYWKEHTTNGRDIHT